MGNGIGELGARVVASLAVVVALLALVVFSASGPMQSGWAASAGTPTNLGNANTLVSSGRLQAGLTVALQGAPAQQNPSGAVLQLSTVSGENLTVTVAVDAVTPALATVSVRDGGVVVCSAGAPVQDTLRTNCGGIPITLTLAYNQTGAVVLGTLTTS